MLQAARSRICKSLAGFLLAAFCFGHSASAEDSYLLALTWQPAFCAAEAHAASPECRIAPKDKPRLVLHGLWPDWDVNRDGKRNAGDDFCIAGESSRKAMMAMDGDDWLKLPAVKLSQASISDLEQAMPGTAAGLDRHEWWKHGTCSELAADDYFAIAIALLREVERGALARLVVDNAGRTVARKQLLDAFERDFGPKSARALGLDCTGDALQEIRIRLKRTTVAQGLTVQTLSLPAKAPRGDCAAEIRIPGWQ
jgi:ribonuclease T2